jgi:hypothetical protein
VDGDSVATPKAPVEEMMGEAGHGGVEFGISDFAFSRQDGRLARLPFGVASQGTIHCHGHILMSMFGEVQAVTG